ncbi:hypothetical protein AHAS_Ahas12G0162500 [Arachis hypogaea]
MRMEMATSEHHFSSVIEFNKILASVVKMKQYNTAVSLVSMLEFKGITPSIVTMNILINCSCHLDQTDSAFSALAKIIKWAHRFCVITLKFEHHSVRVLYQSKG